MFRFERPEYLQLLYIVPLLIAGLYLYYRNYKSLLDRFVSPKLQGSITPGKSGFKFFLKNGIFLLVLILLILSLANPQIGSKFEEVKQSGIDVYILLDVSQSMKAEDIKPNRLEKAKNQIGMLIQRLKGDRLGLIVFSGEAYIQFPLTTDYSAAGLFLNAVDFNTVPQPGTSIADAIRLAGSSFKDDEKTQKAIIIITDGEDHEGAVFDAVDEAVDKGIKIYTIGLGSPTGTPIPIYDRNGNQVDYKKDSEGNTILTKLDEASLEEISEKGNGKYYRGSNSQNELDDIYTDLSKIEKSEYGSRRISDYEDRYYYFLAPALLLLFIEFFISERKSAFWERLNKKLGIAKDDSENV
jgi:Ca-activated chloride channel family protein